jgi:hypothetical protein
MRKTAALLALATVPLFVSASPLQDRESAPGVGVLCLSMFIYWAEEQGHRCYPGADPEYQSYLAEQADRFDTYLTRNMEGGAETLALFKESQGLGIRDHAGVCRADEDRDFYSSLQTDFRERIGTTIDEVLARDGTPSWGDCI